jgi:hypothetical protein
MKSPRGAVKVAQPGLGTSSGVRFLPLGTIAERSKQQKGITNRLGGLLMVSLSPFGGQSVLKLFPQVDGILCSRSGGLQAAGIHSVDQNVSVLLQQRLVAKVRESA